MVKTVAIVSLFSGILGEQFIEHELKIGLSRLESYGLKVKFMDNALRGVDYLNEHPQARASDLLQGSPVFSGEILGGCIDSIYDMFNAERYADSAAICQKYELFPTQGDWKGKILLLETSEEQPSPEKYRNMLVQLKNTGIFGVLSGILIGKPMDEKYAEEYRKIIVDVVDNPGLPIVWNLNVGHATPRCIVPFGVAAIVDVDAQRIDFTKPQIVIYPEKKDGPPMIINKAKSYFPHLVGT